MASTISCASCSDDLSPSIYRMLRLAYPIAMFGERARSEGSALQNGRERADEAGHDVFALKHLVGGDDCLGAVGAIHTGQAALRVHDPHEPGARGQPVSHFAEDLPRPIARRENLDNEVGSERGVANGLRLGKTALTDEGDVGSADGIGIRRQLEATLDINAAELLCAYVRSEGSGDLQRDPAVPQAGRLVDDQRPAHELGV